VKLQAVPVSHETKVPVLASNQADMTISPLSVTPERLKVVDFVTYSRTALCVFGRADNPKVANAKSIDEFNSPDITVAYFTGGGEENWVKKRFPNAKLRGVSTAGTAAPVEEIMAKRADVTPINRVPWQALNRKVKGLKALPDGNNCQDSTEHGHAHRPGHRQEPARVPELAQGRERPDEAQARRGRSAIINTM
jgi:polar amino acid transport system substrate-binding protein